MAKPRCSAKAFFFYLREEIENFMKKMQASVRISFHNRCKTLPFMVDISQHLNNLNKMLQSCK